MDDFREKWLILKSGVSNAPSQDEVLGKKFKIWLDLVSLQPGRG